MVRYFIRGLLKPWVVIPKTQTSLLGRTSLCLNPCSLSPQGQGCNVESGGNKTWFASGASEKNFFVPPLFHMLGYEQANNYQYWIHWNLSLVVTRGWHTHYCLWAFGPGLPGTRRNIHTHTHPDHQTSFINFLHLLRSIASSVSSLRAWQSFSTASLQVLFGLPFGLGPSTSYTMHFFTESSSSLRGTIAHALTVAACSAVIPMLCYLYLISLSQLLPWNLEICLLA